MPNFSFGKRVTISMDTVSLFSGCGGMDIGAKQAGAKIVYATDLLETACGTLQKYFPKSSIEHADIADLDNFPKGDLVVGGYPCQSFSMGGNRDPKKDSRTQLFEHFARCLDLTSPKFFIAENVSGLQNLKGGQFLEQQKERFSNAGKKGYRLSIKVLDAKNYGIPQSRKRVLIVGIRKDVNKAFVFPEATHGKRTKKTPLLKPFASHGEVIKELPLWPTGDFYERPHDPEGHFSWYYMSRNRKRPWVGPAFTVVANWRHITLHPASPVMKLTWSNLSDGWKQRWDFSDEYEHIEEDKDRPILNEPRRLSWQECAMIQTFPKNFEPIGKTEEKFTQIGNAVPPELARIIVEELVSGRGLISARKESPKQCVKQSQLSLW